MCNLQASIALACDYDGTLAHRGAVSDATLRALERFRQSGRKLFLVTGRLLPELERLLPRLDLFDAIVAENGPVLFHPRAHETTLLAARRSDCLIVELRKRGVDITAGEVVLAALRKYETQIDDAIRSAGLDLQLIYNKDSVMILPPEVDKMSGLRAALASSEIAAEQVIAVGDGENDEPMLAGCGCGVAVANAVAELKTKADFVTAGERGEGVIEVIERVLGSG